MAKTCSYLTIFEGPDGAGKTTAARIYAEEHGAAYVHFGPLPRVTKGLGRIYVEAMMPALLGYQNVVFDRSWLSEAPYGMAFREGQDRLSGASRRMLERLAMRCSAVVVRCDPGWQEVENNFKAKKRVEMLADTNQLKLVYDSYRRQRTDLPEVIWDYKMNSETFHNPYLEISKSRYTPHYIDLRTAGNSMADIVIVGEDFAEVKDCDSFYQWPFASFSGEGCSQWLTSQLDQANISEDKILWVNADQDLTFLTGQYTAVYALGAKAEAELYKLKIPAVSVPHPQMWKRFRSREQYPLVQYLTGKKPS